MKEHEDLLLLVDAKLKNAITLELGKRVGNFVMVRNRRRVTG